jgi:RimJ/RimL family protein N-acetyltransferase
MKPKIEFLQDSKLREFSEYLEKIPYSAYQKDVELDEKDILSFRYYHGNRYIIAKENGNIVGHLCIMFPYSKYGYHQEHIIEVHINVLPEFQSKGVGKALLEFFIKDIHKNNKKSGIMKIKTKMLASNRPVINLFEKFGFKKEGVLEKEWKIVMEKEGKKIICYEDAVYMCLML